MAVIGLSVLGVLLITSAVEMSTERDGDANDELLAAGAANVASGLGGGFVGEEFVDGLAADETMGIPVAAESHWQAGVIERHGALLQDKLKKMIDTFQPRDFKEWQVVLSQTMAAKNYAV